MADRYKTFSGVLFGMAAGALWGLVFLAPELVRGFGPIHLTAGRYLAYGLLAAGLILPSWRGLARQLDRGDWATLAKLALLGNTVYYIFLVSAVHHAGVALTSLVIGFLPVVVTVVGSRSQGAVPLHRLVPSLTLSAAAGLAIGAETLGRSLQGSAWSQVWGLACAVGALVSWTMFALGNSRALARLEHVSAHEWSLLIGVVTGAQSLLLAPLAMWFEPGEHSRAAWLGLLAISVGIGLLASVLGNACWNRMNRLLPLTLVGQMVLFETLFALLYGFLWEWRLPTALEMAAIGCVVGSVLSCLAAHRRAPKSPL